MIIPKTHFSSEVIEDANTALSFFDDLKDVPIYLIGNTKIKKSFMQAQPLYMDLFKPKEKRRYCIKISSNCKIENYEFKIDEVPSDIRVGWIGHEFGHVMDYLQRSNWEMIKFGFLYLFSKDFFKIAERAADDFAVRNGMAEYILKTKNFILNHTSLPEHYKSKIRRYYLSPEEITLLANEYAEENTLPPIKKLVSQD